MTLSEKGLKFIAKWEGFSPVIYYDVAGFPTIGYGHLLVSDDEYGRTGPISEEQGLEILRGDIGVAEKAVKALVKVPLSQTEYDAIVSWTFNLGRGNLRSSTLLAHLNASRFAKVPDEILKWRKAGGRVVQGLVNRRQAEAKLFEHGHYGESA